MDFCDKCGKLLIPKKIEEKEMLICPNCNFIKEKGDKSVSFKEEFSTIEKGKGAQDGENPLAKYENVCRKCGYDKAEIIDMGVFISDEDNLILLRCGKCGFSKRIGRRTG